MRIDDDTEITKNEKIQALFFSIVNAINCSLSIQKTFDAIMSQIELYFKPKNWSLLRVDPDTHELYFVIAKGIDNDTIKNLRISPGQGIAGKTAKTNKSILIKDVKNHPDFFGHVDSITGMQTDSIVAVPISFRNKVLGVIELINILDKESFTAKDLALLQIIADISGIALSNAIAYEKIAWGSIHDPLTGLYNRRQLSQLINKFKQKTHSKRQRDIDNLNSIAVIVDVDNFKHVNDTYGHAMGDQVLIKLSKILQQCLRDNDYAFRIGGDEFLLLITDLKQADIPAVSYRVEEKLKLCINDIIPADGFSYGMASGSALELESLIKQADNAMYQNKGKHSDNYTFTTP